MALGLKASEGLNPDRQEEELGFFVRIKKHFLAFKLSATSCVFESLRVPLYFEKVMILERSLNLL